MAYLFQYNRKGQKKHHRERILQAMNLIIEYARRQGVSKKDFLSKKIGNSNAKAPEDLKAPYDG